MAKSRSQFYVDIPVGTEPPSQRHSMYVSQSEINSSAKKQDLSSASSSATLPSTAGSVDRLTGLGNEKKTPRFFTLKPKTSFSLRPFFSSSSIANLSPSKSRRKSGRSETASRRDSYVQTEDNERVFDEVGVQTLNASTVDVPVQTCSSEWDVGDTFNYRKSFSSKPTFYSSPYGSYSSRWSPSTLSKPHGYVLKNSEDSKKSVVTPLDSAKLLKYTAPCDSADSSSKAASAKIIEKSCERAAKEECSQTCEKTPATDHFQKKDLKINELVEKPLSCSSESKITSGTYPSRYDNIVSSDTDKLNDKLVKTSDSSVVTPPRVINSKSDIEIHPSRPIDSPISALKSEKSDSPKGSPKIKSVHFKLSKSDSVVEDRKNNIEVKNARNINKEFEDLLRNLDILTDDSEDANIIIQSTPVAEISRNTNPISPDLQSAIDVLKKDYLSPIPESDDNSDECLERNNLEPLTKSVEEPLKENNNKEDLKINIAANVTNEDPKCVFPPTHVENESGHKLLSIKEETCNPTSPSKLELDVTTNDKFENVYDKENTEEPVKTVFLPTLPSCFEPSLRCSNFTPDESVSSSLELQITRSSDSVDKDKEDTMLSRSSSRSSLRSNSRSDFEVCLERANKFDSCENLDQLEEEIIRSLHSPIIDNWETSDHERSSKVPASESPTTNVTIVRRAILDRLLSGESVDEIMPNTPNTNSFDGQFASPADVRKKIKQGKKYTATLSKFEDQNVSNVNHAANIAQNNFYIPENTVTNNNAFNNQPSDNFITNMGKSSIILCPSKNKLESPKDCSVFLFPDTNMQNSGFPTNSKQHFQINEATNHRLIDNAFASVNESDTTSKEKDNLVNSTKCDFSNCLRPSELHNSSFLAEISSKSPSPNNFNTVNYTKQPSSINKSSHVSGKETETKPIKQNGQCDFASCLKPSQVQNSLFTAELNEITANKSSSVNYDSSRTSSPLTIITRSPTPSKNDLLNSMTNVTIEENIAEDSHPNDIQQHKSEITIVLQTPSNNSIPTETKEIEVNDIESHPTNLTTKDSDSHKEINEMEPENSIENISDGILPPPPPPPMPSTMKNTGSSWKNNIKSNSLESQIQEKQSNLTKTAVQSVESKSPPKTSVMLELEEHFKKRSQSLPEEQNSPNTALNVKTDSKEKTPDLEVIKDSRSSENNREIHERHSPLNRIIFETENNNIDLQRKNDNHSVLNGKTDVPYQNGKYSPGTTFITNEPPPAGAVLVDRKVTVEGDKVHTDKFYALPVKEVTKETTSTTKFIPAPPKYEGIGPTEDGIPIGLRNSVKKENMHNWYKTMYKSLHKADSSNDPQEYIIGYSSEPESSKNEKILRKKSPTFDSDTSMRNMSHVHKFGPGYPPSAKSSIEIYNVRPRLIEDYEPGQSSVTDDEITTGSKRFLPPMNVPKPSYEFKNGYEQDNHYVKSVEQPDPPTIDQQKTWYKEVQLGGEIPQYGLGKLFPDKPRDPIIGPLPPPPLHYNGPTIALQVSRPSDLPANYSPNENYTYHPMNGAYEIQMRQAVHTELHQRLSPSSSSQLSSPTRSILKSPCKTPDLKIPAQALFDFRAESPKELSLKKGENVSILRQLDKNWYEGEKQGILGIFPINYIEIVPPEHAYLTPSSFQGLGKVLYDFTAHTPAELTVKKHDTISLIRRVDANWYEAELENKKGIVPASYMQVLQEPVDRNTPLSSPVSRISSPGSRPISREGILKTVSSPIPYNSNISNPAVITNGRNKLQSRSKKTSNLIEPVMYKALYSYTPQNSDELELSDGDTVYVVEMCDDGWFVGTSVRTGVFGIFPGNYVEKV